MKNILFAVLAVLLLSLGGCLKGDVNTEIVVKHSFTSPNDIPGCSPSLEVYFPCPTAPVTVNLPGFTQKIDLKLPAGASASAYIDEMDVISTTGYDLSFLQELTVEVSAPNIATYPLVDYKPSVTGGTVLHLFPDDVDLVPYIEAPETTFTIAVYGTVPTAEVPLDVEITIDAEASYHRGL